MEDLPLSLPEPGAVARGFLAPDVGAEARLPYVVVRGGRPGPTLLVTAGVHGAEYASIEAAYRVARTDPEALTGTLVVLPIVNPPAFFARSIYVNPVDGENLNRAFPGRADGTYAERLAHWLTDGFLRRVDAYVDLHGGDMIESLTPFSIFDGDHAPSRELAAAFGLPLAVAGGGTGMTYAAAAAHGVPAVLAEAGGQGRWPDEAVRPLVDGVARVMARLGMIEAAPAAGETRFLSRFAWLRAEHDGLWYPRVEGGDRVEEGQELGEVRDLQGEVLQRAVAPLAGVVLFAVSSLAMNEGDPLLGIGA